MTIDALRALLDAQKEEGYRAFSAVLLPGVTGILGVRIPTLRKIAKDIAKTPFAHELLAVTAPQSFEETLIIAFVRALVPASFDARLAHIAAFVPYIDNWSVCDSFCATLKELRAHREETFAFLAPYLQSHEEYPARFGTVMLLFHFVDEPFVDRALAALEALPATGYYARMAVAWALQTFYAAYPQPIAQSLLRGAFDTQTTKLALSKISASRKTDRTALTQLRTGLMQKGILAE